MSDNGIKNVAIYTRVSTEDQATQGFSLDAQLEKLKAYCFSQDYTIQDVYVDDGYSGTNIKRPRYQKMFENIKKWDGILVMKMDRIHRNRLNFIQMMNDLKKQDKEFVSMSETLNTSTAMGCFVMGIIQDIAELESKQTGERTYIGMKEKAKQRGYTGHRACVGFEAVKTDVIGKAGKLLSKLVPIPKDLAIVKEIYELYNEGLSMTDLAQRFKDVRVQTTKGTKPIVLSTIQYILKNPLYAGYYKWHDVIKKADDIEPIISKTLFDLVQKRKCQEADRGDYIPLLIKDKDVFEIPKEKIKDMPAIRRAKHNISY